MSSSSTDLFLYTAISEHDPEGPTRLDERPQVDGLDVYFPDGVDGWTDVLDCRVEPYTEKSIRENSTFAHHVHKKYILVSAAQAEA